MSKQEKIVCAAVRIHFLDAAKDYDYDTLCDYSYEQIESSSSYKRYHFLHGSTAKDERGFRTNTGRFVDPKEAMKIAVESEQLEGFLNANYWDGFAGRIGDPETSCKELADEYLKRELKPEDLY